MIASLVLLMRFLLRRLDDPLHEQKEAIIENLVFQIRPLLRLVHDGVIPWAAARAILAERYGYDFDEKPPPPDWAPDQNWRELVNGVFKNPLRSRKDERPS